MEQPRVLIIDDEKAICEACSTVLTQEHYDVQTSHDGETGLEKVDAFKPDIVFVDLKMPGMSGIDVIRAIKEKNPDIVPIVITGYASIDSAVESMKAGAYDFLPKPFTPAQLRIIAERALDKRLASLEAERLRCEKEKMRQGFISMVSHELRTPLVAVIQYLEVLNNSFAGSISGDQGKIIDRMKVRMTELLRMIDRWLKLARLEELKLKEDFAVFDIEPVILEAIDLVKNIAAEKNVSVEYNACSSEAAIKGDRDLIKEVLVNLIGNGVKYNHIGGKVDVSIGEQGVHWVISIRDTGIGIPAGELPHVIEEFYRVKREGVAAGTGIGLSIVKKILDIHEGKLEIASVLNQGSTFSVFLPKIEPSIKGDR
ncbi:MAG: response regulator [candidate division WOR-3 bacterium]|nr:response regulator [candidate division WOR-3 bacterium]